MITAPEVTSKVVKTEDGVWTFQKWDADSKASAEGVKFTGIWTFAKNAGTINYIPELNAEDKELTVGDSFDPMKDVTASDKEDGDLTEELEVVENTVDTSKAGTYTVTYKVTDKDGAFTLKTINGVVKNKDGQTIVPETLDKGDTRSSQSAVPGKGNGTDSPTTGDSVNLTLWSVLFAVSVLLLGVLLVGIRRKKKE